MKPRPLDVILLTVILVGGALALLTGLTTWYRPGGRLTKEAIVAAHEKLVLSSVAPGATPSRAPTRRSPSPSA